VLALWQAPAGARKLNRLLPLLTDEMTIGGTGPAGTSLAFIVSPPPPGQDSGPAASIRHRHRQPGRGIASVVGTNDRDGRTDAHELSDGPGKLAAIRG
jgi:hypothetical protein